MESCGNQRVVFLAGKVRKLSRPYQRNIIQFIFQPVSYFHNTEPSCFLSLTTYTDKERITFFRPGIFPSLLLEVTVKRWYCAVGVLSSDCSMFQLCVRLFALGASQSAQSVASVGRAMKVQQQESHAVTSMPCPALGRWGRLRKENRAVCDV